LVEIATPSAFLLEELRTGQSSALGCC